MREGKGSSDHGKGVLGLEGWLSEGCVQATGQERNFKLRKNGPGSKGVSNKGRKEEAETKLKTRI